MENPREKKLRKLAFNVSGVFLLWLFGLNFATDWVNPAMLSYMVLLFLCVLVVGLSSIYWWETDGTSAVFRMLVMLASGIGIDAAVQAWSRYLWLSGQEDRFDLFRATWLWDYRQVGEIVALVYLLAVIVSRMRTSVGYER